jgi:dTDP-4-amino-4,6-dideoxygalactose transaminase
MKKLNGHLERRRHIARRYNSELGHLIEIPEWTETV